MKRFIFIFAVAVFCTIASGASAVGGPTLRIVTRSPLVVSGTHFKASERVTVKMATRSRVVRTTSLGSFRVSFGTALADRCSGWRVIAVGTLGDRATIAQHVMCPMAKTS